MNQIVKRHSQRNSSTEYLDSKAGWIIYPVLGVSFIFFANDNDFKSLIRLPSFKWDLMFSIIAVTIIGFYLAWLVRRLDKNKKFSWENAFKKRVFLQFFYGIAIPLFFAIGIEIIYLDLIDITISQSTIFVLELPLSFIYLFIINLLYYLNHLTFSYQKKVKEQDTSKASTEKIKILEGSKENLLPIKDIAFLRSVDKLLWLYTFYEKQFHLNGSLNEWAAKLPKQYFYRLNRQIIAHRNAILSIETTETRRLKVFLKDFKDCVYIPKTKATDFRNWWQN